MTEDLNITIHPDDLKAALTEFYKHCDGSHGFEGAVHAALVAYRQVHPCLSAQP